MTTTFFDAAAAQITKAQTNGHRPPQHPPVLVLLGTLLGALIGWGLRFRTAGLTVAAAVMASWAAYDWWGQPGMLAAGALSCLVIEVLVHTETERR